MKKKTPWGGIKKALQSKTKIPASLSKKRKTIKWTEQKTENRIEIPKLQNCKKKKTPIRYYEAFFFILTQNFYFEDEKLTRSAHKLLLS
jgi:hypothetical protein